MLLEMRGAPAVALTGVGALTNEGGRLRNKRCRKDWTSCRRVAEEQARVVRCLAVGGLVVVVFGS